MRTTAPVLLLATSLLAGCGAASTPACVESFSLSAAPQSAPSPTAGGVADHNAKAPGNQQQFLASSGVEVVSGRCAVPAVIAIVHAQWTVSDNIDVQISSAADQTNGLATCIGATLAPATVTASYTQGGVTKTSSTTLTCK